LASFKRQTKAGTIDPKNIKDLELFCSILRFLFHHLYESILCTAPFYNEKDLSDLSVESTDKEEVALTSEIQKENSTEQQPQPQPQQQQQQQQQQHQHQHRNSVTYVSIFKPHELHYLQHQFDQFLQTHHNQFKLKTFQSTNSQNDSKNEKNQENPLPQWQLFDWLRSELIPKLINFVSAIDLCYGNVVYLLTDLFSELALTFGQTFTVIVLKSLIEEEIASLSSPSEHREGLYILHSTRIIFQNFIILKVFCFVCEF
jgi:hypothetical protein